MLIPRRYKPLAGLDRIAAQELCGGHGTAACGLQLVDLHGVFSGLDEQTLGGKLLFEVATRARQNGIPCYAVPGRDELDLFEHRLMNIEVEAGTRAGVASPCDVEKAAQRVARRMLG